MMNSIITSVNRFNPFYRQQFIEEQKNIENEQKYPNNENEQKLDVSELIQRNIRNSIFFHKYPSFAMELGNPEKSTRCVVGYVQSGKSEVICLSALYSVLVHRKSVVICVRDLTQDYEQLAMNFNIRYAEYGVTPVYMGGKLDGEINRAFLLDEPTIFICLFNASQMDKMTKFMRNSIRNPLNMFNLIVDEVDQLAYKNPKEEHKPYISSFKNIRAYAHHYIGITATPTDMFLLESELVNGEVYIMPEPQNYRGLTGTHYVNLNQSLPASCFKISLCNGEYVLGTDRNRDVCNGVFYGCIETLKRTPIYNNAVNGTESHPVICLIKPPQPTNNDMRMYMALSATDNRIMNDFATIMYNGEDGVWFYHHSYKHNDELVINLANGKQLKSTRISMGNLGITEDMGIHVFKGASIGHVLQFLYDEDINVKRMPRVLVFSAIMANRGTNFVSNGCSNNVYGLRHLTHEIYKESNTSAAPELVQSMRIFGIYDKTNITPVLFAEQSTFNEIHKYYKLIKRMNDDEKEAGGLLNMRELMETKPIYDGFIPKKTSRKVKVQYNAVHSIEAQRDPPQAIELPEVKEDKVEEESVEEKVYDMDGYICWKTDITKSRYDNLLYILEHYRSNNVCDEWIPQSILELAMYKEQNKGGMRTFDKRNLPSMRNSVNISQSRIQYKKTGATRNALVFYRVIDN